MTGPGPARRAISVAAPIAIFAAVYSYYGSLATSSAYVFVLLSCSYVVAPGLVVAALAVRTRRGLARVDIGALVFGLATNLASLRGYASAPLSNTQTDEHLLDSLALRSLIAGHNPYLQVFPQVAHDGYGTPLFTGGSVDRFAYPPLPIELGAVLHLFDHHLTSPVALDLIAFAVLGIVAFFALPVAWRPLMAVVLFGLGPEHGAVAAGYGVVVAAVFACAALYRWTSIGRDGHLWWSGYLRAALLGLACASYQLAWVLAVFVVLAVFLARRPEVGWARALAAAVRFAAVTVVFFLLPGLPFLLRHPHNYVVSLLSVFTQRAIVFGDGWGLALLYLTRGSGAIALMSVATALLVLALLAVFAGGFRWLAPAVAVFATLCFALSSRTAGIYVVGFWPVWVVAAATTDRELLAAHARRLVPDRLPKWRTPAVTTAAAVAVLAVPLVVFAVAVATPPQTDVHPVSEQISPAGAILGVTLRVRNDSDHTVRSAYYVGQVTRVTNEWTLVAGQRSLRAGQTSDIVIAPPSNQPTPHVSANLSVVALVPSPESMSVVPMLVRRKDVQVVGRSRVPRSFTRCQIAVASGVLAQCSNALGSVTTAAAVTSGPPRTALHAECVRTSRVGRVRRGDRRGRATARSATASACRCSPRTDRAVRSPHVRRPARTSVRSRQAHATRSPRRSATRRSC